ncbi:PTP10-like protein [Mya arenaria]|uniref:PTP10-like protein n=1 Tax=Mya arenaria TaxID=6604 RepID=A0ABY7F6J0_MYAAR|nr:PTP10-like protein [Mya arenaria]
MTAVAQKEDGEDKGPMAAIGGGATGGVLVIGVVVTAIVILRLRFGRKNKKSSDRKTVSTDFTTNPHTTINESETSPTYENALRIATPKTNASNQKQQIQAPPCRKDYKRRKKPNTESKPKTEHNLELDDNDSIARDIAIRFEEKGGIYYNNTETVSRDKIRIDTLAKYVGEKQEHEYEEEFEVNDETRVKVRDGESDYINASYIDKPKCEQYWPEPGTSKLYGEVKVTSETEQSFSEFTRRSFILIKGSEKRKLHHLHFTCWPDKDVPDDVTSIIDFRQAVINSASLLHGPLLVHCRTVEPKSDEEHRAVERNKLKDGNRPSADDVGLYFPADNQVLSSGSFTVSSQKEVQPTYTKRTLKFEHSGLTGRMSFEGEASVVNAVRKVRSRRTTAIPCKEQFHFCYDCLLEYVNTHDGNTYCNIQEACSRQKFGFEYRLVFIFVLNYSTITHLNGVSAVNNDFNLSTLVICLFFACCKYFTFNNNQILV